MTNKKTIASLGLTLGMLFSINTFAADGTVQFKGAILDKACTIEASNVVVDFGSIVKSSLAIAGGTTSATAFNIQLKECPETIKSATIRFDGVGNSVNPDLFTITTGVGKASNVAIALFDSQNQKVIPNMSSGTYALVATTPNTLNFVAKLQATGVATVGAIETTSNFTVVYP